ncbi:hypothetical protein FOZ62_028874, partial [Perkinsus olseni]
MRLALVVAVLLHASLGKDLPSKKPSFLAAGGTPPITSLYSQPIGRCYSSRGELKDCTCSNGTVPFFTEFYAWCPSSTRCLHTPDIGRSTESEMINAALFVLVQVLTCGLLMLQADANVLAVGADSRDKTHVAAVVGLDEASQPTDDSTDACLAKLGGAAG